MQIAPLKLGDVVDIIAPASRCAQSVVDDLISLLTSWGLKPHVPELLFSDDLLCANSDTARFSQLEIALTNNKSKAVICVRGGYGSLRLIPQLLDIPSPQIAKWFIGMSDVTALHLFLQQYWHWPGIHGSLATEKFSPASIHQVKHLLFNERSEISISGIALNEAAKKERTIERLLTGGNLTIVQTSMATPWQIHAENKLLFLEEVGERAYRVDRMLAHLRQAQALDSIAALIFGDFLGGLEPNGRNLIPEVLTRFAQECPFPVIQIAGAGHGFLNTPLVLGAPARLTLGTHIQLVTGINFT